MPSDIREPTPASFDEFEFVKPGSLFPPPLAAANKHYTVNQALPDPLGIPLPSDVCYSMINMNRPRQTIQAHPAPVTVVDSEDIRGCDNLKNHAVPAGPMYSTGRVK